jgi:hypothetical protein
MVKVSQCFFCYIKQGYLLRYSSVCLSFLYGDTSQSVEAADGT